MLLRFELMAFASGVDLFFMEVGEMATLWIGQSRVWQWEKHTAGLTLPTCI
jgi:hypothetical protein